MGVVILNNNSIQSNRNSLRLSALQEDTLKLFTDLFLWELSVGKEPSQTCSQERDYQKDENDMMQGQISCDEHSNRLTTFNSYLWKSGLNQNWNPFNDYNPMPST